MFQRSFIDDLLQIRHAYTKDQAEFQSSLDKENFQRNVDSMRAITNANKQSLRYGKADDSVIRLDSTASCEAVLKAQNCSIDEINLEASQVAAQILTGTNVNQQMQMETGEAEMVEDYIFLHFYFELVILISHDIK